MLQVINFDLSHYKLERPFLADTVEKLDKNGGLFFCRKAKHSELLSALTM
jgi:hypothetical protein